MEGAAAPPGAHTAGARRNLGCADPGPQDEARVRIHSPAEPVSIQQLLTRRPLAGLATHPHPSPGDDGPRAELTWETSGRAGG